MPDLLYSRSFEKDSLGLLELSNEEIARCIESEGELVIKGRPEDDAVLCTKTKTFSLREVNTSNSLLLAQPQPSGQMHVVDDISRTIELVPCLPRLARIDELLLPTLYAGPSLEERHSQKPMYTLDDLLSIVQASEAELEQGLKARNAVVIDGKYRMFDLSYLHQLLDALVTNATIEGLDLENMEIEKAQACILQLEDIPQSVVNGCLDTFCDRLGNNRLTLNKDRVCRFLGQAALASERGKEWRLEEFLDVWKALVPDIFAVEMDMLRGLYIVSERVVTQQRRQQYITYFPVNELPTDPAQRFARLFTEKKRWTEQEIVPYLEDLAPDAKKRDALLLKYTRTQRDHGTLYYGTKIK